MSPAGAGPANGELVDNAAHPLETQVVRLVRQHLERRWMWDRVRLEIRFILRPDEGALSDFNVNVVDGLLYGRARLQFNYLFLIQDEATFCDHIVPHQCAHLLAEADALSAGIKIEPHGPEWQDHLARLSADTPPTPSPVRELGGGSFDGRPVRLMRDGAPALCECPDGYHVFTGRYQKRIGEQKCRACKSVFQPAEDADMPPDVRRAYEYVTHENVYRS